MSKFSNTIEYNLRTTLDATGLTQLQQQLNRISSQLDDMGKKDVFRKDEFAEAQRNVQQLQTALQKSFNSSLNIFDLKTFKKELGSLSLSNLQDSMSKVQGGAQAFNNMLGTVGQIDTSFKSISSFSDKIFNTMGNTVRWGITASIFQEIQNSLYRAVDYVKELDTSLNNIRIVTGASNQDMRDFALYANESAQAIGSSTTAFTNAAQLYAQNGFNEQDYTRLAEITTKVANVTQQNTVDVSEQITALMEGYHMSIDQVEDALGGMAVVAAASAADLEELATAEQKVASTANTLGVSHEQLTAQIGTIVSVTRQAPESVGNAMRTLYARIADLRMGETLDDGTTLGNLSGQLEEIGIEVLDQQGNLRNLGDVLEDLQDKWGDLTNAQQIALGTKLAGKYQLNPFMALMENADMYNEQLEMMQTSQGALDEQQAIYMDSVAAKLQALSTAGEGLITHLFNADDFKPFIDGMTDSVNLITQLVDAVGGLNGVFKVVGATATRVFSKQIAGGITNILQNFEKRNIQKSNEDILREFGMNNGIIGSGDTAAAQFLQNSIGIRSTLTGDQKEQYNSFLRQLVSLDNEVADATDRVRLAEEQKNAVINEQIHLLSQQGVLMNKNGEIDASYARTQEKRQANLANSLETQEAIQDILLNITTPMGGDVLENTIDAYYENLDALMATGKVSEKDLRGIERQMTALVDASDQDYTKGMKQLQIVLENISNELDDNIAKLNAMENEVESAKNRVADADANVQQAQNERDMAQKGQQMGKSNSGRLIDTIDLQQQTANLINMVGAASQLVFAFQSLSTIPMIWDSEELTNAEKMQQTLMLIAMDAPMVLTAIMPMIDGFKSLGKLAKVGVEELLLLGNAQKKVEGQVLSGAAAWLANAAGLTGFTVASEAGTAATVTLTGALKTLFTTLLTNPWTWVAVGMTAIIAVGKAIWDAYNEAENAAVRARDRANEVAQAYDNVKSSYEDLQSSVSSYSSAVDTMNQLEQGTDEWKQSLIEVNEQVLALIDKYPELAQYVSLVNGVLEVDEEGIEAVTRAQAERVAEAQLASAAASQTANEAEVQAQRVELGRDIVYTTEAPRSYTYTRGPREAETVTTQHAVSEERINALMDAISRQGLGVLDSEDAIADALGVEVADPIVEAIQDAAPQIAEQFNQEQAQRLADATSMEGAIQNLLMGQEGYDSSSVANNALVSYLSRATTEGGSYYEVSLENISGFSADELAAQLLQSVYPNATDYTIDGDSISFTDAEGNEIDTISLDAAKQMVAAMDAANTAANNWRDIAGMVEGVALSDAAHNTSGLSDALLSGNADTAYDFSALSDADLQEIASGRYTVEDFGITSELAEEQGYADAQAYADAFIEQANAELSQRGLDELDLQPGDVFGAYSSVYSGHTSYDQDEIDNFLAQNGFSEDDFASAREYARANTGDEAGEFSYDLTQLEEHATALQEQIEQAKAAGEAYDELQNELDATNAELDIQNGILDDLAVETMSAYKGLQELGEVLAEDSDILLSGRRDSEEYMQALESVRESAAKALNVDPGSLSEDFLTNAENIELMKQAAEGSEEALSQLRASAGQDIIQHVSISGVSDEEASALRGELADLASQLPDVEVGANIDDTPFVQKLGEMLKNGQLTANQINNILSGMGYDVSIDYVPFKVSTFHFEAGKKIQINDAGSFLQNVTSSIGAMTAQFPQIHTTKRGGGGSGGWRPSSSSSPKGTGGGSGGGGGGGGGKGGGGGSSYTPQKKDPVEDEVDRYERVNAELDTLSNIFEKIADEQERLVGNEMTKNMSHQISLLKEQIKWQEEKLKIQKEEAAEYRDELANDYGITFDTEGHITNYAEQYKRLLNNLNSLIDEYNRTTTESGQKALEERIEAAQKEFDNYNDLIEKYDELISSSIIESETQIQDFYNQIEDLQIEVFQTAVEAADNLKDLQESIIDFNAVFSGLDSDSPYRDMATAFENLKTYWDIGKESMNDYYDELIARNNEAMKDATEEQRIALEHQNALLEIAREQYGKGTFEEGGTGLFDMAFANVNAILEQMRQFNETGTSSIFGENSAAIYETAQDIYEQATSLVEDYEGHLDDLKDAILDAIDEIGEAMEERLEMYENINDELDHYANVIEMIQGDQAYDSLNENLSAMINNNQAAIKELQANLTVLYDLRDSMEEGSEQWKAVNELITDQEKEILSLTEDTLDSMLEKYENTMNSILDQWIGSTGMGDDLDWIAEEWELINRNADYYLDDVNAAYEIQKLQGKYLDLLDNSNQLDIQNQITQQMQEQLAYLREKDKLSEYDVQYANAQLEILQKQIALQEAQRNKSQLQLRRDTQGNYSYVYTVDENEVRNAQGDLLDAQNNAYNLSKDQMKQTQDDSLSALQDARDTLEQIWTNANLTLDEKVARTQTIIDSLKEYLQGTSEQLSESEKNIINDFLGMCEILTDENDARLQDVYEQIIAGNTNAFDQIDTRWQTSITNWLQNIEDFNESMTGDDGLFDQLLDNFKDYQEETDGLGELVGETFDDMSDSIQNAVDKTNDLANSTADFINQLKNDAGTVKEYENNLAEMTEKIQDAENAMKAYQEQVNKLQQDLQAQQQENANLQTQVKDLTSQLEEQKRKNEAASSGGGGGGGGGGKGGGSANSALAWGIAQNIWTYGTRGGWGNNPTRSSKLTAAYGSAFARQVQNIINQNYRNGSLVNFGSSKYSSYNLIGYDTGGYTGAAWTPDEAQNGKIAILHEKELVLNATDTENILNAVDMVRGMVAMARDGAYSNVVNQSNGAIDMTSIWDNLPDGLGTTTYQVECTFPNATNVDEIQRAILTLPDIAPQYAYKS